MNLRARQEGNVLIFELEGHLDFETAVQFKDACREVIKIKNAEQVVFNLEKLKFVGSSGINQFIKVMKEFNSKKDKPKICAPSSEFEKLFRALQTQRHPFQIFCEEKEAIDSFAPPIELDPKKLSH